MRYIGGGVGHCVISPTQSTEGDDGLEGAAEGDVDIDYENKNDLNNSKDDLDDVEQDGSDLEGDDDDFGPEDGEDVDFNREDDGFRPDAPPNKLTTACLNNEPGCPRPLSPNAKPSTSKP